MGPPGVADAPEKTFSKIRRRELELQLEAGDEEWLLVRPASHIERGSVERNAIVVLSANFAVENHHIRILPFVDRGPSVR